MIMDSVLSMKTSAGLLDKVRRAAARKLSPNELMEQRVSFVFGSMDSDNGVTKDKVRKVILAQVGSVEGIDR